jgi:hypothetical protein
MWGPYRVSHGLKGDETIVQESQPTELQASALYGRGEIMVPPAVLEL